MPGIEPGTGIAGVGTTRTQAYRIIRKGNGGPYQLIAGPVTIDGANARDGGNTSNVEYLRAGLVLGKITSGGKYAPSFLGSLAADYTSDVATSMTVAAATVTELVRRVGSSGTFKLTGPPTDSGTVATEQITYSAASGTTITITATSTDFVDGSLVQPEDGSETPVCIIDDGQPMRVTDRDDNDMSLELAGRGLIGGLIDSSQIIDWPADATALQTWIKGQLNDPDRTGSSFLFDDAL